MYVKLKIYFRNKRIIENPTLDHICSCFTSLTTKRNEFLLNQGRICKHYFYVIKRCLRLFTTNNEYIHTTRYFAFERAFITAQQRTYGFLSFDALEKVQWVMKYQPGFLIKVSNKMAASYVGLVPSTLSRTKSKI